MKKFLNLVLKQWVPLSVVIATLGFCLMQTDDLQNIGAILFPLGLLPIAVRLSKYKD
jgi:Na+/phosphate symporter